jgi:glycosyltransferase involved in cell wall biosynthesis
MTSDPTFSIILAAYNAADTIQSAVRSVLAQTRSDFELIVVDDGSTDGTGQRAAAFDDPRIVVVRQAENGGTAAALNRGLPLVRGRYVSRIDADDLYLPTYLEEMEQTLLAAPDAGFAYTDLWVLDGRSHRILRTTAMASEDPPASPPSDPSELLLELLERSFMHSSGMVHRSALETVGPFNPSLRNAQDYEMWLRLLAHGYRGVPAPRLLAVYRRTPGARRLSVSADLLAGAKAKREIYRLVAEEYDVPEPARIVARRRMADSEAKIEAVLRSRARRRFVPTPLRRLLGRGYRALRSRGTWYEVPPPEIAMAFPDLRSL